MLLPDFGLVLARVGGLVFAVPMFSSRQIPRAAKIWLTVTIALMAFPVVTPYLPKSLSLGQAAAGMAGEFIIGEIIGMGAGLIFYAAQVAGKVVSHQSGMALGTVFNPVFDAESTVLDQIWFFTALMIFLALRGHIAIVSVLLNSFKGVPPLMASFDGGVADFLISILRHMFELGLRLGGPVVLALLLSSLVMGFLTRTMPQMNILSIGFNIKVAAALLVMALTISFSLGAMSDALAESMDRLGLFFEYLAKRVINGA